MKNNVCVRRCVAALTAVIAASLPGAAGCWGPTGTPHTTEAAPAFADAALADYLPPDVGAVYTVHPQQALDSPAGRRLAGPLRQFLDAEKRDHRWLDWLGADPAKDADATRLLFCPPDLQKPLVLFHGRFDAAHFSLGPGKLREGPQGRFRLYDTGGPGAAYLAPAGDTLAVSLSRPLLLAALEYAAAPQPQEPKDPTMRELLRDVDRDQTVWLAVSFPKLGPVPRLNDFALETVLRPVLRRAESLRGGVRFGDDVRAEFVVRARTEGDAAPLERDLQDACQVAQGAYLLPGVDPSLLPLLRLMGTGTTRRDGREVILHCESPADLLAP